MFHSLFFNDRRNTTDAYELSLQFIRFELEKLKITKGFELLQKM